MEVNRTNSEKVALARFLRDLEIIVSKSDDAYTVFTKSEPLFCFERKTLNEINSLVEEAIRSYIDSFFKVGRFTLKVESEELPKHLIPHSVLRPISKIKPSVPELVGFAA